MGAEEMDAAQQGGGTATPNELERGLDSFAPAHKRLPLIIIIALRCMCGC